MINPTRRALLGATVLAPIAACTPAHRVAALEKLKDISQGLTDAVSQYGALLFPAEVAQIVANNQTIQALTAGDWIGTARVLVRAIVQIAARIAPLIPFGGAAEAVATVVAFLTNFAGFTAAGPNTRIPTEDEAHAAAMALRRIR